MRQGCGSPCAWSKTISLRAKIPLYFLPSVRCARAASQCRIYGRSSEISARLARPYPCTRKFRCISCFPSRHAALSQRRICGCLLKVSKQWAGPYPRMQKLHCISCFPAGRAGLSPTQNLWLFFGSLHASGKALSPCVKNTLSFLLPNRCTRIVPTRNLRPFFEGRRARARRGHLNDAEGRSYRYGHKGISLLRQSLSTNNRIALFSTNFPGFQTEFVLWQ